MPVTDQIFNQNNSILKKYQEIYVGSYSYRELLKYELLTFFFASIPGAAGFFLRKLFYTRLFGKAGYGTIIDSGITVRCPRNIQIGNNAIIDRNVVLDAKGNTSEIIIGDNAYIGRNSILSCKKGKIRLGDYVSIGPNTFIKASNSEIIVGSHVSSGANSVFISGNIDYQRLDIPMMEQRGPSLGIKIRNDVWIGVGVNVVDGASIGNGSVVGSGSVVMKNIPDFAIASGRPPIIIGSRLSKSD